MARRDGTGPTGEGEMTGRGLGDCASNSENKGTDKKSILGFGFGLGRGRGRGRGMGLGRMMPWATNNKGANNENSSSNG